MNYKFYLIGGERFMTPHLIYPVCHSTQLLMLERKLMTILNQNYEPRKKNRDFIVVDKRLDH